MLIEIVYGSKQSFTNCTTDVESRDSSVGTVTRLRAGRSTIRGSIPSRAGDLSLLHNIQTRSGAHPVSYIMRFSLVNQYDRESDLSSPSSAEVKNGGALPPLPHT
jgi:hypothetical protein